MNIKLTYLKKVSIMELIKFMRLPKLKKIK